MTSPMTVTAATRKAEMMPGIASGNSTSRNRWVRVMPMALAAAMVGWSSVRKTSIKNGVSTTRLYVGRPLGLQQVGGGDDRAGGHGDRGQHKMLNQSLGDVIGVMSKPVPPDQRLRIWIEASGDDANHLSNRDHGAAIFVNGRSPIGAPSAVTTA